MSNTDNRYLYVNTAGHIYKLISCSGLESAAYDTETPAFASSDGGYFSKSTVPPRRITISFTVDYPSNNETARAEVLQYFLPNLPCTLRVTRGTTVRDIDYYVETGPEVINADASYSKIRFTVHLICPYPFFRDAFVTQNFAAGLVTITNTTLVPIYFLVTITATGGSVVNPKISLGSGGSRFISVTKTLADTDVLQISTQPGSKYVKYEGVYCYDYTLDSDFFTIEGYGSKGIYLTADSGAAYAVATCKHYPMHLGV
jgi:hypothetical protein